MPSVKNREVPQVGQHVTLMNRLRDITATVLEVRGDKVLLHLHERDEIGGWYYAFEFREVRDPPK